jgi:hypothetical protein
MKNIFISLICLILIALCCDPTNAQSVSDKKRKIKIIGTVIGFDSFAATGNLTFAPQSQLLIVRIDKSLKGKEKAQYIKIIYEYFSSEDTFLPNLISSEKKQWKFNLVKENSCDSSLQEVKYGKSTSLDGKEEIKFLRLKDIGGLKNISESIELPCYILKSDGLKLIN